MNDEQLSERHLSGLQAALRGVVEEIRDIAQGAPYVVWEIFIKHQSTLEGLVQSLNERALTIEDQLALLQDPQSLDEQASSAPFHPHDPVWRFEPARRRTELTRRALRGHVRRIKQAGSKGELSEGSLRHLSRVYLDPRLSDEQWRELVLQDVTQELKSSALAGSHLLKRVRELLSEEQQHPRYREQLHWLVHRNMRQLHRYHHERFEELRRDSLELLRWRTLNVIAHASRLSEAALELQRSGDWGDDELKRAYLNAFYQLVDLQYRALPWIVIARQRQQILDQIKSWFDQLHKVEGVILELFGEGDSAASLRDHLSENPELIQEILSFAQGDSYKELLSLLGRLQSYEAKRAARLLSEREAQLERAALQTQQTEELKEQLVGVELGDELARLLPSDLGLLATGPETGEELSLLELLFFQRFTEKTLNIYQRSGEEGVLRATSVELPEAEERRGPYIICVDNSASMAGRPELLAKALTFQLAMRAAEEGRGCYLIAFSMRTTQLELTSPSGVTALLKFLSGGFTGGTNLNPALRHAHGLLTEEGGSYQSADVVVISDFELPKPKPQICQEIDQLRAQGTSYHGVSVGRYAPSLELMGCFDQMWSLSSDEDQLSLSSLSELPEEAASQRGLF